MKPVKEHGVCVILGFCVEIAENCVLLGYNNNNNNNSSSNNNNNNNRLKLYNLHRKYNCYSEGSKFVPNFLRFAESCVGLQPVSR